MTVVEMSPAPTEEQLREHRSQRTAELFEQLKGTTGAERKEILDEIVVINMRVARAVAARYRGRGVAQEDLEQVAHAALVRCVHKFDGRAGGDLLSYAVPSIRGEVRRYFRDHGWMVRPPRRVQEIQSKVIAEREAWAEKGTPPDLSAIAATLDVSVEDVEAALSAQGCFQPVSLDTPVSVDGGAALGDLLIGESSEHDDFACADARLVVAPLLKSLGQREQRLIHLRFFECLTQTEIAAQLGVTQTQVSRLLTKLLAQLRELIGDDEHSHASAVAA